MLYTHDKLPIMPKNVKSKKNSAKREVVEKRELMLKEVLPGTVYGQVLKALGECNFRVRCSDGIERICHLRKSIKRQIVLVESVILVGTRDFQVDKGDVVYVYTYDEATKLKNMREIDFNLSSGVSLESEDEEDDEKNAEEVFNFEDI